MIIKWHKLGNRKVAWFGDLEYKYTGFIHPPCQNWPHILTSLKDEIENYFHVVINSVLCNFYPNGLSCIPYHSDNEAILGNEPNIYSLSCPLVLKDNFGLKINWETHFLQLLRMDLY